MGLFDYEATQPGLMSGFMSGNWTGDKDKNAAVQQALLSAGLGLLSGQNFGQAGMQGLQAYGGHLQQNRQNAMQDWQFKQQQEEAKRKQLQFDQQQRLATLPGQFSIPGMKPPTMDNRDVGQPGEAPIPAAGFDMPGYLAALKSIDPAGALQLEQSMQKTGPKFGHAPAGSAIFNESTGQTVGAVPQKPESTPDALRAIDLIYPPGSPENIRMRQEYAKKLTTHQPPFSVSYGAPVAGQDAHGNPVFFQPPTKGAEAPRILQGVTPPPKEMPSSMREKFASNAVMLQKLDGALGMLDQRPQSLGMQNYLPDAVTQRTDPEGVPLRAAIADIAGQRIHDRSGASVTVGESARLKPYIPNPTDTPEAARTKLRAMRTEYASMQQELQGGASIKEATGMQSATKRAASSPVSGRLTPAEQDELNQLRQMLGRK